MAHDDTHGIHPNTYADTHRYARGNTYDNTHRDGKNRERRFSPGYFRADEQPPSIAEQDPGGLTGIGTTAIGAAPIPSPAAPPARGAGSAVSGSCAAPARSFDRRQGCERRNGDNEPGYLPLSRTTDRVLRIMLDGDLARVRAQSIAETLGISCTTMRRRLRDDHTSYQFLLDRARQYRCESRLREGWLPGKWMAEELGYLEINSFYRAFRRWTGLSYSAYKETYHKEVYHC